MEKNDQFNLRNPEYLESYKPFRNKKSLSQISENIEIQIKKKGSNHLQYLDAMAGSGIVGYEMKKHFPMLNIVFQDKSEKMLSSDVYEANEEKILSDVRSLSCRDQTFDIITCRGGLNNVSKEDYPKILREYLRVVRNDGIIILQDHFAQTDEQKQVINEIESEIANLEGRSDETYIPTIDELDELICEVGGKIKRKQTFEIRLSLKNRFASKGLTNINISEIKNILTRQKVIQFEQTEDDIVLIYPINTIAFGKEVPVITFSNQEKIYEVLETNIEERRKMGINFLESESQTGSFLSYLSSNRDEVSEGQSSKEVFSTLIIADALGSVKDGNALQKQLLQYIKKQAENGLLTFFEDKDLITPDSDTNALGFSILLENRYIDTEDANKVLDQILMHTNNDNIVQTWISNDRLNYIDHVVATNVLYLACLLGRERELKQTEEYIIEQLDSDEYLSGSRYYHSPDSFLYFLSRLIKFPKMKQNLETRLMQQLQKRIKKTDYPLDLAMRVSLSKLLGVQNEEEIQKLLQFQRQDGSWPTDALYREGKKPIFYGNEFIPTALSVQALE